MEEKSQTALGSNNVIYEDQAYLQNQTGTALLDKFTHCLLVKCSSDVSNVDIHYFYIVLRLAAILLIHYLSGNRNACIS